MLFSLMKCRVACCGVLLSAGDGVVLCWCWVLQSLYK